LTEIAETADGLKADLPAALREPPAVEPVPRRKRWMGQVKGFGVGMLGGAVIGVLFAWASGDDTFLGGDWPLWIKIPLFLVVFQLLLWLSVLVHELGHMGAAVLWGWRPFMLSVGPVRLQFGATWTQRQWRRNPQGLGIAGFSANLPPIGAPGQMNRGFAWSVACGPLASLALAGVALWFWQSGLVSELAGTALLLACLSGVLGLVNLVPFRSVGFASDGGQLLELWRGDPAVHERLGLALLQAQSLGGRRPREWDEALVAQVASAQSEPSAKRLGPLLLAIRAQDEGKPRVAHDHFLAYAEGLHDGGLASIAKPFQAALLLPVATYLAQELGEPSAAHRWLDAALKEKGKRPANPP